MGFHGISLSLEYQLINESCYEFVPLDSSYCILMLVLALHPEPTTWIKLIKEFPTLLLSMIISRKLLATDSENVK